MNLGGCQPRTPDRGPPRKSDRYPLDNVPGDLPPSPVVEPRGPRVSMPGQVLDVLQGYVLFQEVGNRRHAEGVGRELAG